MTIFKPQSHKEPERHRRDQRLGHGEAAPRGGTVVNAEERVQRRRRDPRQHNQDLKDDRIEPSDTLPCKLISNSMNREDKIGAGSRGEVVPFDGLRSPNDSTNLHFANSRLFTPCPTTKRYSSGIRGCSGPLGI